MKNQFDPDAEIHHKQSSVSGPIGGWGIGQIIVPHKDSVAETSDHYLKPVQICPVCESSFDSNFACDCTRNLTLYDRRRLDLAFEALKRR